MVLLFLLLTFLGYIDAIGWVGQYITTDNSNCQKLQQHYDRKEWLNYKNRYNEASEQLGDGDYPPNFLASSLIPDGVPPPWHYFGLTDIRDIANNIGNSGINSNHAPRCHGIKFSTRLGPDYDPTLGFSTPQGIDHRTTVQYFCFEKNVGFSAVAFQSGRLVASLPAMPNGFIMNTVWSSSQTNCFVFETVNSEYIEVYTFSTRNEASFGLAFMSHGQEGLQISHPRTISHLFQTSDGYITVDITSPPVSDKLSVSVGVDGLVDKAKFGEIALTNIKCVNSPFPGLKVAQDDRFVDRRVFNQHWEVAVPGSTSNYLAKIMNRCGTQFRPDTAVRFTASNVATTICKRPDGTCFQAHPGTTYFTLAFSVCHERGGTLPTNDPNWFDDTCCDSLLEHYPWTEIMWAWSNVIMDSTNTRQFEDWRAQGIDMVDAVADRVEDNVVMSMKSQAVDDEGGRFTNDVFVGDPIEIHFEYDQECPVLEVSFEFRPSDNNQDKIQEVARFPIYKRPGIYVSFMPLKTDMTLQQLDDMVNGQTLFHDEDGFQDTFIPYHDVNFVTGDWAIPNYYLGDDGLNRYSHYQLGLRGALRVPENRRCVFFVPTSSGKVWFSLGGKVLIDSDGKRMNQSSISGIAMGEPTAFVNLEAGEYTYFDLTYLHYGRPFGNEVTLVSLIWHCEGFSMEVIPRKYIFNHGSSNGRHGNLLTDTEHVGYPGAIGLFKISLEFPPSENKIVRCTAPDGLIISPLYNTITIPTTPPTTTPKTATTRFGGPGGYHWNSWPWIIIYEDPSFNGNVGPDEAIRCSLDDQETLIYVDRGYKPAAKLSMTAAGLYSKFFWADQWQVETDSLQVSGGPHFTQLIGIKYYTYFSLYIQLMHDTIQNEEKTTHPVVGFAFNFGPNVLAAYPTVNSAAWKPYFREPIANIRPDQRLLITEGEGSLTIKTSHGVECNIKRVAERYMDISCDIPGFFFRKDLIQQWSGIIVQEWSGSPLPLKDNFFKYPTQAQHLRQFDNGYNRYTPKWDSLPEDPSFSSDNAPSADSGRNFDLRCFDVDKEKKFISDAKSLDFSSPSIWRLIERNGGCPLLDDLYPSLHVLYWIDVDFGGNIDTASLTQYIYEHCLMSMYLSKITSCFSNFYFNQNDARASVKNQLWYLTGTFIDISDKVPQNLVQSYKSDGQFCNKDGHLVGTPPQCACIGNGQYPNCDSSVLCGPSNSCQLAALADGFPTTTEVFPQVQENIDYWTTPNTRVKLDVWKEFTQIWTGSYIQKSGLIFQWEYMGGSTSGVYMQVWRHNEADEFTLIGQNHVLSSVEDEINVVTVSPADRIFAEFGDFIGWTFEEKAAFRYEDNLRHVFQAVWTEKSGIGWTTPGDRGRFPGGGNRRYQVRAIINRAPPPSATYCNQERSLVIDPHSGHAIYCYTGFCTSWESVTSQRGLSLGTNPCDTPYCVTAVDRKEDHVAWYGLTECGTGVVSRNAGRDWELVSVLDDDHCLDDAGMHCAKTIPDSGSTVPVEYNNLLWSWSLEEICVETAGVDMKPRKYCVKWFCDCVNAEIWANLI